MSLKRLDPGGESGKARFYLDKYIKLIYDECISLIYGGCYEKTEYQKVNFDYFDAFISGYNLVYVPLFDYPRGYGGYCNRKCPMGLNVVELVKNDCDFGTECIQCGACVDNCQKKALSYGFKRSK